MKLKPCFFFLLICTHLLAGCRTQPGSTDPTRTTKPESLADKITVTATSSIPVITLEPTKEHATPSVMPTPTAASVYKPELDVVIGEIPTCPGFAGNISEYPDFHINGTIAYQGSARKGLSMMVGAEQNYISLHEPKDQQVSVFGFSPDGEWLAYAPVVRDYSQEFWFETQKLILRSSGGNTLEQTLSLDEWLGVIEECCDFQRYFGAWYGYWINNELLHLELSGVERTPATVIVTIPTVYDPFSGSWQQRWYDELPDRYQIQPDNRKGHEVGLSPDESRVVYATQSGSLVLRDIVTDKTIWSANDYQNTPGEYIAWAPDSSAIIVSTYGYPFEELSVAVIDRDGNIKRIAKPEYPFVSQAIMLMRWSPDSRYLAIIDGFVETEPSVFLFDMRENRYLYRCPIYSDGVIIDVVWSPDGKWIAVSGNDRNTNQENIRLLNFQSGQVYAFLDDAELVGWSEEIFRISDLEQ